MRLQYSGIAVFNFDGALTNRTAFLALIRSTHGAQALLIGLLRHSLTILRCLLGILPNAVFKEILFTYFYGNTPPHHKPQETTQQLSPTIISRMLYQGAWNQIHWHQAHGHRIVILSSLPQALLAPWCRQYGFEFLISTSVQDKKHPVLPLLKHYPRQQRFGYGSVHSDQLYLQYCACSCYLPLRSALQPFFFSTSSRWSGLLYRFLYLTYIFLFLLLPFSISYHLGVHQINIPSEPLLLLAAFLSISWFVLYGGWPKSFYQGPITLSSILFLLVLVASTIFSTHIIVSVKYTFIAVLHWWVFFHSIPLLFDKHPKQLLQLPLHYGVSFLLILFFAWYQHAQYDFRIDISVLTARPFYFDHALYSCVILLLLGPALGSLHRHQNRHWKAIFAISTALLSLGLYLSFSRAAWLSAITSITLLGGISLFRLYFRHLLFLSLSLMTLLYMGQPLLLQQLQQNKAPSKTANQEEHLRSALNITTDVSNLERINRYSCAWRMFLHRPHSGFGPGTFQFAYLSYQLPEEMTRISVTKPGPHRAGRGGGAHSEYLQTLSETGWPGLLSWVLIVLTTFWASLRIYHHSPTSYFSVLALGILFSLSTYFIHGLVNNFLHHDKVAALFWSYLAILHQLLSPLPQAFGAMPRRR